MSPATHVVEFEGGALVRGFWLYVWEVTSPSGDQVFYVGRTGDSSSTNAQSPFRRMGQHLGFVENQNMLRRHLADRDVAPEECRFRLVAHGPILEEADDWTEHRRRRDVVAGLELALERSMRAAGYDVMNVVHSTKPLDKSRFEQVRATFAVQFPALRAV